MPAVQGVEDVLDGPVDRFGPVDGECRVCGGGQDVLLGHGVSGGPELVADALFGATALAHVAMDAACEADRGWSFDVDGEGVEGEQFGIVEG